MDEQTIFIVKEIGILRGDFKEEFEGLKKYIDNNITTQRECNARMRGIKERYDPIKRRVNFMVGLVLTGVILALLNLVITHKNGKAYGNQSNIKQSKKGKVHLRASRLDNKKDLSNLSKIMGESPGKL